ncbi:MAG: hypothetical protein C9356_08780 [Oleiphilus sp.]|nr:MAG: hypothetical protein C9356_08780 [Oleiphilus sp.]
MSSVNAMPTEQEQAQRRKSQLKLLGIFAVATVPVIAAFVMYFGGIAIPGNTTNKGHLLWPPAEISVLGKYENSASAIIAQEQKWFLMLSGNGACSEQCLDLLHAMRQVHVSMGRELERVGRMLVGVTDQQGTLLKQYPKLKMAVLDPSMQGRVAPLLSDGEVSADAWVIWLVDPLGNVLLRYDAEHTGYDMISDLKRLLKLSNIG